MPARKGTKTTIVKEEQSTGFTFPNKKVRIEVVDRIASPVIKDRDGSEAVMMVGTSISFGLPTTQFGYVDPFIIYAEMEGKDYTFARDVQEKLEKALGLDAGALITSLPTADQINSSIWGEKAFKIFLKKRTRDLASAAVDLNLLNPVDFVKYMVALGSNKCANTYAERFNSMDYLTTIRDNATDRVKELSTIEKRAEASARILTFKKSGDSVMLYSLYKLLDMNVEQFRPSRNLNSKSPIEDFFSELMEALENPTSLSHLIDFSNFSDKELDDYYVFFVAQEQGAIKKVQNRWMQNDGRLIGSTPQEVIDWLAKDDNAQLRLALKDK